VHIVVHGRLKIKERKCLDFLMVWQPAVYLPASLRDAAEIKVNQTRSNQIKPLFFSGVSRFTPYRDAVLLAPFALPNAPGGHAPARVDTLGLGLSWGGVFR
jgi:hypothetical protein